MSPFTPQKVLLDACVIYPVSIRDILLYSAAEELFDPFWTDAIQNEWTRNALQKAKNTTRKSLENTVRMMNQYFRDSNISDYEHLIPILKLPDPDDRHVLAAAIVGNVDRLLTFNLKDFPTDYIRTFGIEVQHPDDFICELIQTNEAAVKVAFEAQISKLKNPPMTILEGIEALEKNGMAKSGQRLREVF